MIEARRVFVVARIGWAVDPQPDGDYTHIWPDLMNTSGEDRRFVPVAVFGTREAAEARMRQLELEAARVFNPFWRIGPLSALTCEKPLDFIAWLSALVLPLPWHDFTNAHPNRRDWRVWWDEYAPMWPDEVLEKVWDVFDQVRFYTVLELEFE